MKKFLLALVAVVIGGYYAISVSKNNTERNAKNQQIEQLHRTTKAQVNEMVQHTNAVDDWELILYGAEDYPKRNVVMSIDLERVWLRDRPLLFIGTIQDIKTYDDLNYRIDLRSDWRVNSGTSLGHNWKVSLVADKTLLDDFLAKYPELFEEYQLNTGVAVVAKISKIGDVNRTGQGSLISIAFAGDAYF